ncbi:RNA 3'-terminal phosphate cyclase/enolpyruvate transferase alpha/beta [Penicillium concentricum]|uniref:RNA 3'-terminal phosphate cyclase/enolpyruvate transferase alpha/beta n=1 Tax=Penicillium concentricum TaxID=293559 RepID=A0A9W9UWU5_9EURO|nr:RNA 3'-terminal phosphate cyclase/enolpyruvate transferase alpha/beta [Penicillium concentricum]KAJ5360312.1 RNA 3'-terminal phosphate cyclase/enolpyruvate transferase alpha/beta [Penicillium concentricum]
MAARSSSSNHVYLNGRTLEGGGQLVRIAIGLSALTGRPVSIDHVRGNREGKKGLKRTHAAAVKLLAEISGSKVSGGEVGSQFLNFFPQSIRSKRGPLLDLSQVTVKSEYDIKLTTAGATCLVFQALYPYLLYAGSQATAPFIKVNITGGTNVTLSPSYDYVAQVIVPNFVKLGLPPLSIILQKRGWSTGPVELGAVTFLIHTLASEHNPIDENQPKGSPEKDRNQTAERLCSFPRINLMDHKRGKVTQIDITVLAPDKPTINGDAEEGTGSTVRQFIEQVTQRTLRRETRKLDPSIFAKRSTSSRHKEDSVSEPSAKDTPVPIKIHTSEATNHHSHVYILLVAHTSSGFRISNDIQGGVGGNRLPKPKKQGKQKQQPAHGPRCDSQSESSFSAAAELVHRCVKGFIGEISYESPNAQPDQKNPSNAKRSCLDASTRDQVVVFEALGKACHGGVHDAEATDMETLEDERDWTLHTKTAQWVCRQMLNV